MYGLVVKTYSFGAAVQCIVVEIFGSVVADAPHAGSARRIEHPSMAGDSVQQKCSSNQKTTSCEEYFSTFHFSEWLIFK